MQPFEQVVTDHGAVVLRVCRAVLGADRAAAEDAWAETFVAALRAYPELRPGSDVRAWLVTIAHRKAIDQVRRRARGAVPMATLPEVSVDGVPAADDGLLDALAALPPKQRAAIAYRYLADLSYADVAELLGGTQAAARRCAADGIAALRAAYPGGPP